MYEIIYNTFTCNTIFSAKLKACSIHLLFCTCYFISFFLCVACSFYLSRTVILFPSNSLSYTLNCHQTPIITSLSTLILWICTFLCFYLFHFLDCLILLLSLSFHLTLSDFFLVHRSICSLFGQFFVCFSNEFNCSTFCKAGAKKRRYAEADANVN